MTPRGKSPFAPPRFSVPSLLVGAVWVGLWMVWPGGWRPAPSGQRGVLSTRVVYLPPSAPGLSRYALPTLFVESGGKAAAAAGEDDAVAALAVREVNRPPLLPPPPVRAAAAAGLTVSAPDPAASASRAFDPLWGKGVAFAAPTGTQMRALVQISPGLKACGFRLPAVPDELAPPSGKPWQVVLFAEVGEDGRPSDVFVDVPCADPRVNTALTRMVLSGQASPEARGCKGRVTVSYSRQ